MAASVQVQPAGSSRVSTGGRIARAYGAHPAHLLLMVACFALIGYLVAVAGISTFWDPQVWWQSILVWFLGAVIVHDLILFPLYATADRSLVAALSLGHSGAATPPGGRPSVPVLNYVRIPAMATALVTVLFLPGIIEQGKNSYLHATGQTQAPFALRWLLLCVAFFLLGALAFAARLVVVRWGQGHAGVPGDRPPGGTGADPRAPSSRIEVRDRAGTSAVSSGTRPRMLDPCDDPSAPRHRLPPLKTARSPRPAVQATGAIIGFVALLVAVVVVLRHRRDQPAVSRGPSRFRGKRRPHRRNRVLCAQ